MLRCVQIIETIRFSKLEHLQCFRVGKKFGKFEYLEEHGAVVDGQIVGTILCILGVHLKGLS